MPKKIYLSDKQRELYESARKLSKKINQQIVRLEREFGKDKWRSKAA